MTVVPVSIFPNSFIQNKKIPANTKLIFQLLCSYDNDGQNCRQGWVEVSIEQLSNDSGLTSGAVIEHVKRLVKLSMVTVVYRNSRMGGARSSIYILNVLPGVSMEDLAKIRSVAEVGIRNAISGINCVRLKTAKGEQHMFPEEFCMDLIELYYEDVLYAEIESFEGPELLVTGSGKVVKSKTIRRVMPEKLAEFYKYQYNLCFNKQVSVTGKQTLEIFIALQREFDDELIQRIITTFIWKYMDLFYTREWPLPKLYSLRQEWVINKILDNVEGDTVRQKDEDLEEIIDMEGFNFYDT